MKVFRLSRKKYAKTLSGKGAALFGNRWNSKGVEMIYTAESRALAMAEVAVHLSIAKLPEDFMMLEIEIPKAVSVCELKKQPKKGWNDNPPTFISQELGDTFIRDGDCCLIKVPSAVVQGDFSYLINPYHLDFKKIKIVSAVAFPFDTRMFK